MIEIDEIQIYLGSLIEVNYIIEKKYNLKKGSIFALTGIKRRSIAKKNETSESLAYRASKLFKNSKLKNLSHIISVTNTPSIKFPGISNYLANSLNLSHVHCLNLNQGCTGFVDALSLSYEIIKNNNKAQVLILTADTYSKFLNKNYKAVRCLFSDGASATIIKYKKNGLKLKKKFFNNLTNTFNDLQFNKKEIKMNGPAVVSFALKEVVPKITSMSKHAGSIYSHQAGKIVMSQIKKKIDPKIFFPINYEKHGNLVSTSIPLLIKQNMEKFKKEKKIIFCGFGVGLSTSIILFQR